MRTRHLSFLSAVTTLALLLLTIQGPVLIPVAFAGPDTPNTGTVGSTPSQPPGKLARPEPEGNGDLVQATNFSVPCASGIGVGIAFDGTYVWYSCHASSPDLFKAEPLTGQVVASYNVAGGLGALAWDGSRKKIWAGWGGGAGGYVVRLIDPTTGTGTVVFDASGTIVYGLDDGLAYDAQDDTLYISDDGSTTIYHYSVGGALLGSFPWAGSSCYNSGLAIGGELLFQGSNGCNHIWVVKRSDHTPAFDFNTGAGGVRDEDLECDSVTFSPKTVMWSVEAYEPRRAIAFEIPPGTCATGGGVDSDGDGLLDEWETAGITIDPDGAGPLPAQFIDLPAMGADKNKPDVFLHVDWMEDAGHSHKLSSSAIKKVVEAFAVAPYTSPTGSVGINLHVDQGADSILNFSTNTTWGALSKARALTHVDNLGTSSGGGYNWSAFQAIKDAAGGLTESGRTPIFHYVISAHNYDTTTSSGISRGIGASDLIVSLGSFTGGTGTSDEQGGTLMHELGHNLSLRHGGGDDVNFKPNYLSIMNYAFQLEGLIHGGVAGAFDYSRSTLGALTETSLNEPVGLGAAASGYGTRHFCAGAGYVVAANADGPIDWNCNGDNTNVGVAYDVNNSGSAADTLTGFDDWTSVKFKGGAIGLAGITPDLPVETELELLTVELAQQIVPFGGGGSQVFGWTFLDTNGDGWRQASEQAGLAGVPLTLAQGGTPVAQTGSVGTDGWYQFDSVTPGQYCLQAAIPSQYVATSPTQVCFEVIAGTDKAVNFGVQQARAAIGDYVWYDNNTNGIQDPGESGIAGVTLALLSNNGGAPGGTVMTTTTDADGRYLFDPVAPGAYFVQVTDTQGRLAGHTHTVGPQSQPNPFGPITVVHGQTYRDADFGYVVLPGLGQAVIGDRVWLDANGNGVQDAGEAGIAGVRICASPMGHTGNVCGNTNESGFYHLRVTAPGTYMVAVVTPPAGKQATTPVFYPAVAARPGDRYQVADFGYR